MPRRTAFDRLLEGLNRPPHEYRRSIEVFPDLDVKTIAIELELDSHGKERASEGRKGRGQAQFDDIEMQIVERVDAEKKLAHGILEDEFQTYAKRLTGLDIVGRFSEIERAAPACIAEFRAEVATGRDELHGLRRNLVEHERELEKFRQDHNLKRTARSHSAGMGYLKWAVLFLLWALESAFNGSFLAKGSELGLVGGISEAVGFASLNVMGAVGFATIGARQLNHRGEFRKFIGLIAVIAWIALTLILNLSLAHYREVAGTFVDQGGQRVIQRLVETPLVLSDINSWVLFGVGVLFAAAAFIDGLLLFDPYPGYGSLQKRVDNARGAYMSRKAELVDDLRSICEEYGEIMDELSRDLGVRRGEYDAIIAQRGRLIELFQSHQGQLENAGNALLAIYRRAKGKAASSKQIKLTFAVVTGFAYLRWGVAIQQPTLDARTLCPVDGARSVTIVLLDGTDTLPEIAKLEIRNHLTDVAETLPKYGLLELRLLEPAIAGGRIMFSKCNPGDGSNLSELVANPKRAHRRWLENFQKPLQQALRGTLQPAAADISPIMETVQRIAVERLGGRARKDIPKSLIIVSDMIENAPGYNQYQGDLSYEHFRKTVFYKKLRTNLYGADVDIRYVQRLTATRINSGVHIKFWMDWAQDNNAGQIRAVKLQGAG